MRKRSLGQNHPAGDEVEHCPGQTAPTCSCETWHLLPIAQRMPTHLAEHRFLVAIVGAFLGEF